MTTAILVVGTDAASVAAARFPRALTRVGVVSDESPPQRWVEALFSLIDVAMPRAIAPADEGALGLLIALATTPPPALRHERAAAHAKLMAFSLGPLDLVAARREPADAVEGTTYTHHVAAFDGRVLASATAEHVVVDASARPRPTVLRFCAHDGVAAL